MNQSSIIIFVEFKIMNEQIEFVKIIVQRLESAGFNYMLTGSLALSIYAHPRFTRDIDLVVEFTAEDAERLAALFENDCYVDEIGIRRAALDGTTMPIAELRKLPPE